MKAIRYILILSASLFIFGSCTKQVAGPQGTQGIQGAQGPSATSFVTVDSVAPTAANWPLSNGFYTATLSNIQGLTIPNGVIVQVSVSPIYNSFSTWTPLDATSVLASGDGMEYYYTTSKVVIQYKPSQPTRELYFKVEVIQP